MKAKFSEFSYGFAFTYGFLRTLSPSKVSSAPIFPSLNEEGEIGYDLKLNFRGLPYFFQFKLSDRLVRSTAKQWKQFYKPFYRFDVRPLKQSEQHNLLKDLSYKQPLVFYVAPVFSTTNEFNNAFLKDEVYDRSIWVPLELLPLLDNDSHSISYVNSDYFIWNSMEHETYAGDYSGRHHIGNIEARFQRNDVPFIDRGFVLNLREDLLDILNSRNIRNLPDINADRNIEILRDIRFLLTTFFDLQLVILQTEEDSAVSQP